MFVSPLPCTLREEAPAASQNIFVIHSEHTLKTGNKQQSQNIWFPRQAEAAEGLVTVWKLRSCKPQICGIKTREEHFEIKRFVFSSGCFDIELPQIESHHSPGMDLHPRREPATSATPEGTKLF